MQLETHVSLCVYKKMLQETMLVPRSITDKERTRKKLTLVFVFQSGLMVACYRGYVDVVIALSQCPYLDVNWQDNEGNTALIIAAQAGKHTQNSSLMNAVSCLLNPYENKV